MNTCMKLLFIVLIASFVILGGIVLWYDRTQRIDFVEKFPDTFETCHGDVSGSSSELVKWFSSNKDGWTNHPASLAPGYLYTSSKLNINAHPDWVVVNYFHNENWQQVIKRSQAISIFKDCGSGS